MMAPDRQVLVPHAVLLLFIISFWFCHWSTLRQISYDGNFVSAPVEQYMAIRTLLLFHMVAVFVSAPGEQYMLIRALLLFYMVTIFVSAPGEQYMAIMAFLLLSFGSYFCSIMALLLFL